MTKVYDAYLESVVINIKIYGDKSVEVECLNNNIGCLADDIEELINTYILDQEYLNTFTFAGIEKK